MTSWGWRCFDVPRGFGGSLYAMQVAGSENDGAHSRYRWLWIVGVAATLLGSAAVFVWFVWMPSHRPAVGDAAAYGVDVSVHQGRIDWDRVGNDDISFAYIKATEGGDHVDRHFDDNWVGAAGVGLRRGAYHFFTLCRTGEEKATNFLSTVPTDPTALPPAIDLELSGNCARRPEATDVRREVDTFLEQVEAATGQAVVLYIGDDWEDVYPMRDDLDRPVWYRRILRQPPTDDWWIWQFNYRSNIDGIEGGVDLNVMRAME